MLARMRSIGFVVLIFFITCEQSQYAQIQEKALEARGSGQKGSRLFRQVDISGSGIDFVHRWNPPEKHRDQLTNAFSGGGVAVGDYDQDGLPDIFICGQINGGQLFKNSGGFRFINQSSVLELSLIHI